VNDLRFCEWIRQESEATSGPGAVHQRLIEATDRLAAAAVEIERLRAIVDKLPKTEDGVPVVPGLREAAGGNNGTCHPETGEPK